MHNTLCTLVETFVSRIRRDIVKRTKCEHHHCQRWSFLRENDRIVVIISENSWNVPHFVRVSASAGADGDSSFEIDHSVASQDGDYRGLDNEFVTVYVDTMEEEQPGRSNEFGH